VDLIEKAVGMNTDALEDSSKQGSIDAFIRTMSPQARAMLAKSMKEAETAHDAKQQLVADILYAVMCELGEISPLEQTRKAILEPVLPFVTVAMPLEKKYRGAISIASFERIWHWLSTDIAAESVAQVAKSFATLGDDTRRQAVIEAVQDELADQLADILAKNADNEKKRSKLATNLGGGAVLDDVKEIALVLKRRAFLASMAKNLDEIIKFSRQDAFATLKQRLDTVSSRAAEVYPFVLIQVKNALKTPQAFLRFISFAAETQDDQKIEAARYGYAFQLLLMEMEQAVGQASGVKQNDNSDDLIPAVKTFGAAARSLVNEIEISPMGALGKKLGALRNNMAEVLRPRLEDIVPRAHRLVRPRREDKASAHGLDPYELQALFRNVGVLVAIRPYAEETALSAVTTRAWSELRDILETGMPLLLDRLRNETGDSRRPLQARLEAAVTLCEQVFGAQYAQLQRKAVELAAQDDPRTRRM
jgi:hypothetical protein